MGLFNPDGQEDTAAREAFEKERTAKENAKIKRNKELEEFEAMADEELTTPQETEVKKTE